MGFKRTREVPLKVVVVDGIRWLRHPKSGYYSASQWHYRSAGRLPQLHVYIWEREHGCKVPKGCDVHHKDFNKENNTPDNLVMLTKKEHSKIHNAAKTPDQIEAQRRHLQEVAQPAARAWHKSEAGHKWHIKRAIDMDFGHHDVVKCTCAFCGKEFEGKAQYGKVKSKFCSNAHKSAWRRKMRLDDVDRVCEVCGKTFRVSKYEGTRTCSNECWMKICGRPKGSHDKNPRQRNEKGQYMKGEPCDE